MNSESPEEIKVQICGMSQSGSTLLYNIARLILNRSVSLQDPATAPTYEIIKEHPFGLGSDYTIVTIRDLRDTTLSWMLKHPDKCYGCFIDEEVELNGVVLGPAIMSMVKNMMWLESAVGHASMQNTFIWKYEAYKHNPLKITQRIISFLDLKREFYPVEVIKEIINEAESLINQAPSDPDDPNLNVDEIAWNQKTKMWKIQQTANKGKSGQWRNFIKPEVCNQLEILMFGFLAKYGYHRYACPHCLHETPWLNLEYLPENK